MKVKEEVVSRIVTCGVNGSTTSAERQKTRGQSGEETGPDDGLCSSSWSQPPQHDFPAFATGEEATTVSSPLKAKIATSRTMTEIMRNRVERMVQPYAFGESIVNVFTFPDDEPRVNSPPIMKC
jgi:hypothetical protein